MKNVIVIFASKKLESEFESLENSKYPNNQLYKHIERAITDLKNNPKTGVKIPKKLWPKIHIQEYSITNLWKYNLPDAWRLIYTIKTDEVKIFNIILEWLPHKKYEKRFKY